MTKSRKISKEECERLSKWLKELEDHKKLEDLADSSVDQRLEMNKSRVIDKEAYKQQMMRQMQEALKDPEELKDLTGLKDPEKLEEKQSCFPSGCSGTGCAASGKDSHRVKAFRNEYKEKSL